MIEQNIHRKHAVNVLNVLDLIENIPYQMDLPLFNSEF